MVAGSRRPGPEIEPPADIDPRDLAPEVRSQLRTLSKLAAERVAKHLVAAGRLVDEDPQTALQHARAARALGSRVAVVREAVGETAYAAGEWAEAIAELRTARRMTGDDSGLPMLADAERALGRPDRALRLAQSPEAQALPPAERAEMIIVEAGTRRDLGQLDAALITLQDYGLDRKAVQPWSARVWYAYADLLLTQGREDEAREWFVAAASVDRDGSTDADERVLELDGVEVVADEDEDEAGFVDEDEDDTALLAADEIGPVDDAGAPVSADEYAGKDHEADPLDEAVLIHDGADETALVAADEAGRVDGGAPVGADALTGKDDQADPLDADEAGPVDDDGVPVGADALTGKDDEVELLDADEADMDHAAGVADADADGVVDGDGVVDAGVNDAGVNDEVGDADADDVDGGVDAEEDDEGGRLDAGDDGVVDAGEDDGEDGDAVVGVDGVGAGSRDGGSAPAPGDPVGLVYFSDTGERS